MFAPAAMPVERPSEWRSNSYHNAARSTNNSPSASRRSSISSITSARTDPGLFSDVSRQSSATSTASATSTKSGFRTMFSKKEKKPKEKKNHEKLVLYSKHAAAVKTKMMMDNYQQKNKPQATTASITSGAHTTHLSAAQQEARHPHSGPPALHGVSDMPLLTRIVSGDERDEEDELAMIDRARLEWEAAKTSGFSKIREHETDSGSSPDTSAEQSAEEDEHTLSSIEELKSKLDKALDNSKPRRPVIVTKNSCGGRFRKDENGRWKR